MACSKVPGRRRVRSKVPGQRHMAGMRSAWQNAAVKVVHPRAASRCRVRRRGVAMLARRSCETACNTLVIVWAAGYLYLC